MRLALRERGSTLELVRHHRFVTDDPGVMTGLDHIGITGAEIPSVPSVWTTCRRPLTMAPT